MTFRELQKAVHQTALKTGFWVTKADEDIARKLCLIHSEISEALEDHRNSNMDLWLDPTGKPQGFPSELADAVIRIMDLAERLKIDLFGAIEQKHEYNKTRSFRHGNKRA